MSGVDLFSTTNTISDIPRQSRDRGARSSRLVGKPNGRWRYGRYEIGERGNIYMNVNTTLSRFSSVSEPHRQNVEGKSAGGMQREGNGIDSVGDQTSYTSLLRRCVAAYPTTPIPGKFLLDLAKSAF
ncbi:uncharacterized protein RSE6_13113 [Rhynchosporium secalis]|uniref:Uncharacterized protein n=1 Tax=Rhynchosporium secalis TaxID=38038 RepID=A0A1E1MS17_RHYSE|nr:uncharacterized protein RSE6_13113 [Rhynchosporium secalis]